MVNTITLGLEILTTDFDRAIDEILIKTIKSEIDQLNFRLAQIDHEKERLTNTSKSIEANIHELYRKLNELENRV